MNNKRTWLVAGLVLAVVAASIGLVAWLRVREASKFGAHHKVRTYGGTNYVVELLETTVGKTTTGCVLIVYARFHNPNPYPVVLKREWFVLADDDRDYFQPVLAPGQTLAIEIPAHGLTEKTGLQFVVPDDSLRGRLALLVGHQYFTLIKSEKPYAGPLQPGQFRNFRQRDW